MVTHTSNRNAQATHDRVARAALDLFTTYGYHATTTPLLARQAGVAEGTIYRHFSTKEQLLNDVYRAALRLVRRSVPLADPKARVRDQLAAVAQAWRAIASHDPAVVRLVFFARLDDLLDEQSRRLRLELRAALAQLIAAGKAAGEVRSGSADVWADVWLAVILVGLDRMTAPSRPPGASAGTELADAAWAAIAVPPAT